MALKVPGTRRFGRQVDKKSTDWSRFPAEGLIMSEARDPLYCRIAGAEHEEVNLGDLPSGLLNESEFRKNSERSSPLFPLLREWSKPESPPRVSRGTP